MSEYTVFGYGSQLNRNDTAPSTREKKEDCETMPGSIYWGSHQLP